MTGPGADLLPVEPGYRSGLRVRIALTWLVLVIAGLIADLVLWRGAWLGHAIPLGLLVLGVIVAWVAPNRIFRRLRYRLTDRFLQVVRGWMFHSDTIVPLVRVQHLDVVRGPLDKLFGTASLIVHTAGTHNSIVVVPGLAPERAAEIRDVIREHVQSDFA